jgi:hypothetical protein
MFQWERRGLEEEEEEGTVGIMELVGSLQLQFQLILDSSSRVTPI